MLGMVGTMFRCCADGSLAKSVFAERSAVATKVLATALLLLAVSGCGDSAQQKKLDLAQQSVTTALETWSRGERSTALQTASPPIEFHDDDWNLGAKLIEHRITKTYIDTDGQPRCAVELKVQHNGKEPLEVRATYQVLVEPKIVVGRDPMS